MSAKNAILTMTLLLPNTSLEAMLFNVHSHKLQYIKLLVQVTIQAWYEIITTVLIRLLFGFRVVWWVVGTPKLDPQ